MRIAQVSTMSTPVRPTRSGSVEAVVWLLTRELTRMGHDVTVFGAAGSEVAGNMVATLPGPYATEGSPDSWHLCEWINVARALEESGTFDLLHSHAYLWGIPLERLSQAPMLHTLHILPSQDEALLRMMRPGAHVSAISGYQWRAFPHLPSAPVVYHAVDSSQFQFVDQPRDYLLYLGQFTPGKGPIAAVQTAKRVGLRLLLAGPQNRYYREEIAPLVDGVSVQYAGSVTGSARAELLGGANALLYLISEPEPFGLVMPEAMICGTPVVATRLGAVPEVVDEGITGYSTDSLDDLPRQVERAIALDRSLVRTRAEERFSGERMAREYLQIYEGIVGGE